MAHRPGFVTDVPDLLPHSIVRLVPAASQESLSDGDSNLMRIEIKQAMPSRRVLSLPPPGAALAGASRQLDRWRAEQTARMPARTPPAKHPVYIFPQHPAAQRKANLSQSMRLTPSWRQDPSSYQTREDPRQKLLLHQTKNPEPPRGITNRPQVWHSARARSSGRRRKT